MSDPGFFPPRIFSLDEAEALLPQLRPILNVLSRARTQQAEAQRELSERYHGGRGNGHPVPGGELDRLHGAMDQAQEHIQESVAAITGLGCELKDPDRGMVDFRTVRDGRVVYLCWLMEEPRILFWHDLDGGFAGRQPL
ncbi:MAG: hypothetical protein A3F84_11580 [Candidatus Handelsmanbacteria bacterium RIFCSPLOWO2_12_FULL_64_10]|uniref:DUF2203 domain-containing protein n=1 Tax=Handelsmanbacteria sp. (strain RIFCSPLOWO2_12_FULL_64_10) TaxID=1817868 RepID=A0A1F6C9Y0_HANXR|nr:MAG: hypothetical protein A3F84_11580 [Candidatus Handelsmanbacteria bacterium RIFCSPLOWO2_12_FULL_64_10]